MNFGALAVKDYPGAAKLPPGRTLTHVGHRCRKARRHRTCRAASCTLHTWRRSHARDRKSKCNRAKTSSVYPGRCGYSDCSNRNPESRILSSVGYSIRSEIDTPNLVSRRTDFGRPQRQKRGRRNRDAGSWQRTEASLQDALSIRLLLGGGRHGGGGSYQLYRTAVVMASFRVTVSQGSVRKSWWRFRSLSRSITTLGAEWESKTWFYLTASGRKAAPHRMEFVTRWPRTTTCSSRLAPLRPSSALQTSTSAFRFHNRIHPHIGPNGTFSAGAPAAVAAIVLAFLPCPTSRDVLIV